ncbi:chitin deacetylase 1 [Naematelia encephala]|uniref:Chitin deacetylase 1 n=1 Tax=Naematelia encephala TaxID=71784 RepID=A0A1Y2ALM6_9TREE|nr:chitin deacetylase 1 [Naematelia encephala]
MADISSEECEQWLERDFYGYGPNPPNPNWPNEAKIAVNFVMNHEEGGESSVELGDQGAEAFFHDFGPPGLITPVPGERDPSTESQFEYGPRVAVWRLIRLFDKHKIPITFYAVAKSFERNLDVPKHVEANGHETCCHGYRWRSYGDCSPEEEEDHVRKAVESFRKTSPSGRVPPGWFVGRPNARSAHIVAKVYKELGLEFLYWADSYADDLPYWKPMPGNPDEGLLIMPYSFDNNDTKMWFGQYASDDAFTQHAIDTFTTIREEGLEGRPAYITVAFHSRWMGRPGRFQALRRIVEHMLQFDDVWFATREQIARHFANEHPYDPSKFKTTPTSKALNGAANGHGKAQNTTGSL